MSNDATTRFHALSLDEVFKRLTTGKQGLQEEEVRLRQKKFGKNVLPKARGESILKILWRQIKNPLIYILIFSSVLAIALGKTIDGIVVIAVVVINTLIGFIQEFQAGKAINSLMDLVPMNATVLRNGSWVTISAEDLVPGDVVRVISGDKVPADLRLMHLRNLRVEEAALTGESVPVEKNTNVCEDASELADRKNLVFNGTYVTYGHGEGIVVATGKATVLGQISELIETSTELKTPLTKSLEKVANILTIAILVVSLVLLGISVARGLPIADAILTAITLAVAAIPEGLPAIVTIALAIGVKRMAKKNSIIRKLPAVETLGSTTIICTDKTGTLTRNEMTVQQLRVNGKEFTLSGIGYNPAGKITPELSQEDTAVTDLMMGAVLCNDASLVSDNGWKITGDPTEGAIVVAGRKLNLIDEKLRIEHARLDAIPFESENQYMATLQQFPATNLLFVKGAPEVVIKKCSGSDETEILSQASRMAAQGLRVLAVARKAQPSTKINDEDLISGFEFLGLIGMIDPPREEVIGAIEKCHSAGITVKMITGDHAQTATAIGQQLKIVNGEHRGISGAELTKLGAEEIENAALANNVFGRVAPEHKLQIVRALQRKGHVVAMTGDGVNDAPALKQADIGVAMGITGTDVSKEAADMILKDDNFASIVAAVREGRRVYDNLIKSLMFVLPTNLGLAVILVVSVMFFPEFNGTPIHSILPVQALWINMITTVTLALPLAFEKSEAGIMSRPPRKPDEPILSRAVVIRTIVAGLLMGAAAIGLFLYEYYHELPLYGHQIALTEGQTISVTSLVLFQIFYLLHCRSFDNSFSNLNVFTNLSLLGGIVLILLLQLAFIYIPFMNRLFESTSLNTDAWVKTLIVSVLIYPAISVEKFITRRVG